MVSGIRQNTEIHDCYLCGNYGGIWRCCIFLYERQRRQGYDCLPIENLDLVYAEEILFFAVFLLWTYLAGFIRQHTGQRNLWTMVSWKHDAKQDTSGNRSLVFPGQDQLLLWRSVFRRISDEAFRNESRTHIQSDAYFCGSVCFCTSVFAGTPDDSGHAGRVSGWKKNLPSITGFLAGLAVSIAGICIMLSMHRLFR